MVEAEVESKSYRELRGATLATVVGRGLACCTRCERSNTNFLRMVEGIDVTLAAIGDLAIRSIPTDTCSVSGSRCMIDYDGVYEPDRRQVQT